MYNKPFQWQYIFLPSDIELFVWGWSIKMIGAVYDVMVIDHTKLWFMGN